MINVIIFALVVSAVFGLIAFGAFLTYTSICILAGIGFGVVATLLYTEKKFEERKIREEEWKNREYGRILDTIKAVQSLQRAPLDSGKTIDHSDDFSKWKNLLPPPQNRKLIK